MSVRRPFSPPLHSAAHYTRKHLHAGQCAAPPNHAEWADAKRVRSISTVRSVRFEPLGSPITRRPLPGLRSEEPPQKSRSMLWPRAKDSLRPTWQHDLDSVLRFHLVEWGRFQRSYPSYSIFARTTLTIEPVGQELLQTRERYQSQEVPL